MAGGELLGHTRSVRAFVREVKHPFVQQVFGFQVDIEQSFGQTTNVRSGNTCSIQPEAPQMSATYAVVVPHRYGARVPSARVYARRRLVVGLVLLTLVVTLLMSAAQVLASRGGAPASTPVARPAAAAQPAAAAATTYVVQPGDTLWSIATVHRGSEGHVAYVDALVAANGGTSLQVGQQIRLP